MLDQRVVLYSHFLTSMPRTTRSGEDPASRAPMEELQPASVGNSGVAAN